MGYIIQLYIVSASVQYIDIPTNNTINSASNRHFSK